MRDASAFELDPTAREIYDLLRRQPGDHFSAQDIAVQLNEDVADVSRQLRRSSSAGLSRALRQAMTCSTS